MEIVFAIKSLILISLINAFIFYLLVSREIKMKEAYRLTCTATALNKVFFTGSGFLAGSYFSRNKNLPSFKALGAFFILEILSASLWLILGLYFGAKLAVKVPLVLIVALLFVAIALWIKRKSINSFKNVLNYFKNIGSQVALVVPLVAFSALFFVFYYYHLFNFFDFSLGFLETIKIIAVSFTLGYLSPAPAGLGFKETGMVLLLKSAGIDSGVAISVAVCDRVLTTLFWGGLGGIFGFDLIKEELSRRFKKTKTAK
ncbi:MAG: hypothetical protein GY858_01980 [Candidatus Omnitrophica bacterium]|nr:hypothetical protein [Candidatus Omnitrophota bacterium]